MKTYKTIKKLVYAVKWDGSDEAYEEISRIAHIWVKQAYATTCYSIRKPDKAQDILLLTNGPNGNFRIHIGDYLIRNFDGAIVVMPSETFKNTYKLKEE